MAARRLRPEARLSAAAALAAALWACPASMGWAGPADAALQNAASGGAAQSFDGSTSRPPGLLIVADPTEPLPNPSGGPKLIEKKAAVSMKASEILPTERIEAPKSSKSAYAKDGLTTLGGYTSVIGGVTAMAGLTFALPILGVGLLFLLGSRAF
jgi:hypothetical protein